MIFILNIASLVVCVLLGVAFYTLMERKLISLSQNRKGPNKTAVGGILQPISDAIKLLGKELSVNSQSNSVIYIMSPALNLVSSTLIWLVYPFICEFSFMKMSSIFMISCMAFNTITIMAMSWSSNSNYAFIGMMRTISQLISYEINFLMIMITVMNMTTQMSLKMMSHIQSYFPIMVMLAPLAIMWLVTILAETNRTPFDFSEGESELISGFNIEYGSSSFVFLFLAEYSSIMVMSLVTVLMLCGLKPASFLFYVFYMTFCIYFIWTRTTFPRFRYDKLMKLNWTQILPYSTFMLYLSFPGKLYCTK